MSFGPRSIGCYEVLTRGVAVCQVPRPGSRPPWRGFREAKKKCLVIEIGNLIRRVGFLARQALGEPSRPHHPFSAVRGRERQISDWPSLGFTEQLPRDRLGVVSDRATSPVNCTTCYCLSGRLITVRTPRASVDFIESPPVQSRPAQCPAAPSCPSGSSAVCESPRGSLKSEISSLAQAAMHFC
jgi:hypothetical protein